MDSITESELSEASSFSSEDIFNKSSGYQKKFKCDIDGCRKRFRRKWLLENHVRRHNGERPFVCDIQSCKKSYTNKAHLKRHKCLVHERSEELVCDITGCGLVLNNKYSLKKHKNRMHQESNFQFSCTQCTDKFKKKRFLHEHMRTHCTPAPFRCERCNVDFYSQIKWTKHKRNHKSFHCDCGDTFIKWTVFCQHRQTCKININHKCIICNKVFSTQTNLKSHSMVHVEESQKNVFSCHFPNCSRSYQYKKNLTAHIAGFHEKKKECKKFACLEPNCGMIYKHKKNLKLHTKNVHEETKDPVKKIRAPRKDEGKPGKPRKSMASILTGIKLSNEEHKSLLKDYKPGTTKDKEKKNKELKINILNGELENNSESTRNMSIDIVIEPNKIPQQCGRDEITVSDCKKKCGYMH